MTDSEDDLLESFQYSIRNEGTIIHAKGPNINFETISLPSSTMQILPSNDNRPKHGRINYDQRSLFSRRETSPMSSYNISHFSRPYYRRLSTRSHIGSRQSVYNCGNRSPASIRSLDSSASVTASDIVVALKNEHFNKYDQKLLKAACYKFLKSKSRKRLEYMRNRRILMSKVRRQHSTEDLGEMASESSSNSENSISPKIFKPKDTNKVIKTNNVNQVCIGNNYRNVLTSNHNQIVNEDVLQTTAAVTKQRECTNNKDNPCLLKDRFTKGFLLPAHRFSKSANGPISEDILSGNLNKNQVSDVIRPDERDLTENIGSDDEIFSSTKNEKAPEKSITKTRKRTVDSVEPENNPKASKLMKTDTTETENINSVKSNTKNDFNFPRPQMPITKFGKLKKRKIQPEVLISKSSQPLAMVEETVENILSPISKQPQGKTESDIIDLDKRSSSNNESVNTINDVSKRPSFIKRKLFTQKLDVFENKIDNNTSQNSPQVNKYVSGKEKTKPRKLATSQSCLSRDVLTEDNNNLLNLLNKIVPADQMSIIKPTNKPETVNRNSDGDKWDIDSILSTCNPDDGSETYTDEDILGNEKNSNSKSNTQPQSNLTSKEVDEMPQIYNTTNEESGRNGLKEGNKNVTKAYKKSFWDTDIESDWENNVLLPYKLNNTRNKATANQCVNKINCLNNKSIAVSTTKHMNTKLQKIDANKNVNNQKSIWDTDFESDLETCVILPPKSGICKENNVVTNKNSNNTENCQNNKILPVNCKTKTIINSTKCQKVDGNERSADNNPKSIWDTDFESDLERSGILPQAKNLPSCKIAAIKDKKANNEGSCQNNTSTIVESRTKSVINLRSQNVDVNKKTSNNCRKSIWENYGILANRSGNCKTSNTTPVPDKNGSNKENCKKNASIAVNSAINSVAVVKCQRLEDMKISNKCQKFVSQSEPENCKNSVTAHKKVNKNQETVKADCPASIKTRREATKRTPNKVVNGKDKNLKEVQKNNSPEPDHNVSNVSERWLRANRRSKSLNQPKDSLRTVSTLISHRMTRQMMKKLHNSDITTTSKQPNASTELNITNRSLRPRKKREYQRKI